MFLGRKCDKRKVFKKATKEVRYLVIPVYQIKIAINPF